MFNYLFHYHWKSAKTCCQKGTNWHIKLKFGVNIKNTCTNINNKKLLITILACIVRTRFWIIYDQRCTYLNDKYKGIGINLDVVFSQICWLPQQNQSKILLLEDLTRLGPNFWTKGVTIFVFLERPDDASKLLIRRS